MKDNNALRKRGFVLLLITIVLFSLGISACSLTDTQKGNGESKVAGKSEQTSAEEKITEAGKENNPADAEVSAENEEVTEEVQDTEAGQNDDVSDDLSDTVAIQEVLPLEDKFQYKELKIEDWQAWLKEQDQPLFLDFWAPWCGPCKTALPLVDEVAAEFAGEIRVLKINVDLAQEVASLYPTEGIPAFVVLSGEKSKNWMGFDVNTFDEIRTSLKAYLADKAEE